MFSSEEFDHDIDDCYDDKPNEPLSETSTTTISEDWTTTRRQPGMVTPEKKRTKKALDPVAGETKAIVSNFADLVADNIEERFDNETLGDVRAAAACVAVKAAADKAAADKAAADKAAADKAAVKNKQAGRNKKIYQHVSDAAEMQMLNCINNALGADDDSETTVLVGNGNTAPTAQQRNHHQHNTEVTSPSSTPPAQVEPVGKSTLAPLPHDDTSPDDVAMWIPNGGGAFSSDGALAPTDTGAGVVSSAVSMPSPTAMAGMMADTAFWGDILTGVLDVAGSTGCAVLTATMGAAAVAAPPVMVLALASYVVRQNRQSRGELKKVKEELKRDIKQLEQTVVALHQQNADRMEKMHQDTKSEFEIVKNNLKYIRDELQRKPWNELFEQWAHVHDLVRFSDSDMDAQIKSEASRLKVKAKHMLEGTYSRPADAENSAASQLADRRLTLIGVMANAMCCQSVFCQLSNKNRAMVELDKDRNWLIEKIQQEVISLTREATPFQVATDLHPTLAKYAFFLRFLLAQNFSVDSTTTQNQQLEEHRHNGTLITTTTHNAMIEMRVDAGLAFLRTLVDNKKERRVLPDIDLRSPKNLAWFCKWKGEEETRKLLSSQEEAPIAILHSDLMESLGIPLGLHFPSSLKDEEAVELLKQAVLPQSLKAFEKKINQAFCLPSDSEARIHIGLSVIPFHYSKYKLNGGWNCMNYKYAQTERGARVIDMLRCSQLNFSHCFRYALQESCREARNELELQEILTESMMQIMSVAEKPEPYAHVLSVVCSRKMEELPVALYCGSALSEGALSENKRRDRFVELQRMADEVLQSSKNLRGSRARSISWIFASNS